MKIAIYDNQLDYLNLLSKRIGEFFSMMKLEMSMTCHSTKEDFLNATQNEFYQVVFINIDCDNGQGINIAKEFRNNNPHIFLVFIGTKYRDIQEVFHLRAMDYLLIPIQTNELHNVLKRVLKIYYAQNTKFLIHVRGTNYKRFFHVDEIKYVETYYNDLEITTTNNEHFTLHVKNRNILREVLQPRWFLQVSQSVLINMKCIDFLTTQNVILKSREVFTLSHKTVFHCHKKFELFTRSERKKSL